MVGGINSDAEKMGYEFSELIGNGTQETGPLETGFTGIWDTKLPDVRTRAGRSLNRRVEVECG